MGADQKEAESVADTIKSVAVPDKRKSGAESERKKSEAGSEQRKSAAEKRKSSADKRKSEGAEKKTPSDKQKSLAMALDIGESATNVKVKSKSTTAALSQKLVPIKSVLAEDMQLLKPKIMVRRYQNTYRLDSEFPFIIDKVFAIVKTITDTELNDAEYHPVDTVNKATAITQQIRRAVKAARFERYRCVVFILIGQKQMQGITSMVRVLWDEERDKQVVYYFENMTLFAAVTVHGIYFD